MLPPVNESVGAALLKKMGWRPGQGIGPRLTYEQLKRHSEQDGSPLPAVEDLEATKHTYAPRDTKMVSVSRKDDFHGLGYIPVTGLHSEKRATNTSGPRLSCTYFLRVARWAEN
jgi:G patch domain-containing protein 1